jgi:hypothetical protein
MARILWQLYVVASATDGCHAPVGRVVPISEIEAILPYIQAISKNREEMDGAELFQSLMNSMMPFIEGRPLTDSLGVFHLQPAMGIGSHGWSCSLAGSLSLPPGEALCYLIPCFFGDSDRQLLDAAEAAMSAALYLAAKAQRS